MMRLAVVIADVAVGLWLLLSAARQHRHREAVLGVGGFLLFAAVILALI